MAYIGNGRTLLIFGPNVQDDIVPDGVSSTFSLSQEVPGGYEGNVIVVRKRYLIDELVAASTAVSVVAPNKIKVLADQDLAAAFSIVQVPATDNDASNITITGAINAVNNTTNRVTAVVYDGTTIEITLTVANLVSESTNALTVKWGRTTEWEVLEPEQDYVIGGSGNEYNKLITFAGSYIPSTNDRVYVIHKGEATYNFTPSQASVGPDQLQQNLRNFVCDRYTANGSQTTFNLSQEAVNSKTLLVSVDGVQKDGDDPDQSFVGTWQLNTPTTLKTITFHSAPTAGAKIRILHLGFSTVSRRASLSPGQAGVLAPNTVTNSALAPDSVTTDKIAPGGVTHTDIANDAVDGTQILFNNNEYLRGKDSGATPRGLLKISGSNATVLNSVNDFILSVSDVSKITYEHAALALYPNTTNEIKLGTSTKKWKELYVAGTTQLGSTTVTDLTTNGNATINGDITITGTVDNIDISDLQTAVSNLQSQVNALLIPGTMVMWMKDVAAPTGWLTCNGQAVSRVTYTPLFTAIGTTFGVGDGSSTFNVPDLRQRFPLGKAASGTGSGWGNVSGIGGAIDHTHTGGVHTHDMASHTHQVQGHHHAMGAGADLNITISGTHTTTIDIAHSHSLSSTSATTGLSINSGSTDVSSTGTGNATPAISISDPGHSHSGNTGGHATFNTGNSSTGVSTSSATTRISINNSGALDHTHNITANGISGSHQHDYNSLSSNTLASGIDSGGTGVSHQRTTGNPNTSLAHNHGITDSGHSHGISDPQHSHSIAANSHTHTITSGTTGISASQSAHFHTVSITDPGHSHTITDPGHSHTISMTAMPVTTRTDNSGIHIHASSAFAGRIGNVSGGIDGNSNFNTLGPSSANTGSAGAVITSSNNPPFQTVHFIIKT